MDFLQGPPLQIETPVDLLNDGFPVWKMNTIFFMALRPYRAFQDIYINEIPSSWMMIIPGRAVLMPVTTGLSPPKPVIDTSAINPSYWSYQLS